MATASAHYQWKYDVFVSFRGEDIRKTFMGHLFKDFEQNKINAFRDNENVRGEELPPELYKAIEESWFLIVVFSKNFASSSWCLKELTKILECKQKGEPKHEVRIVFYDVKADVVRKQTGSYAKALRKHETSKTTTTDQVATWKEALREATDIIGSDLRSDAYGGYEFKLIDDISKDILDTTRKTRSLYVGENLVGVDDQIEKMGLPRFTGSHKAVHMLGICGISGIGKTTLAKAIYNKMCMDFKGCYFFENVQGVAKTKSITELQMVMINSMVKTKVETIINKSDGIKLIKKMMESNRTLLVLDDVDHLQQLEALAGSHDWFFQGSFIIFTCKNKRLLMSHGVDEDDIYDMPVLPGNKAKELFSLYAFHQKCPTEDFMVLSNQVVDCLEGHPLALKVVGGSLKDEPEKVWESKLVKLRTCSDVDIDEKLLPSFVGLHDLHHKRVFLDIAFSFIGENEDYVARVLGKDDSLAYADMKVLVDKSLITISQKDNSLQMHELIQSMARRIIDEDLYAKKVGSRLRNLSKFSNKLSKNKAIKTVEVLELFLNGSTQSVCIDGEAFEDMKNLRILKICDVGLQRSLKDSKVNYYGGLKSLSNKLKLLYWDGCPFEFPSDFYPQNIVVVDLSYSNLKTLWTTPKCFERLKVMKLRHCCNLTSTPDFTNITNLEELILEGCVNLVEVHPSFSMLRKLVILNMKDCKSFRSFPYKLEMDSLEVMILSGCLEVEKFPEFYGTILKLREVCVDGTAITELPSFVLSQCNLQVLEFGRWLTSSQTSTMQHPQSLVMPSLAGLCFLRKLNFSDCNICEVSVSIGGLSCLESLYLDGNNFTSFPDKCLSQLSRLRHLGLSGCKKLEVLPTLPSKLEYLDANDCTSLHKLEGPLSEDIHSSFAMNFESCPNLFRNLNSSITSHSFRDQLSSLFGYMKFPIKTCEIFNENERHVGGNHLDMIYHGNGIPSWFTNRSMGNDVEVNLPQDWCISKFRGNGICVVLTPKKQPNGSKSDCIKTPNYQVFDNKDKDLELDRSYPFCCNSIRTSESDIIWFRFMPRYYVKGLEGAKDFVTFSFEDNDDFKVKGCGVRLVFDKDTHGEETNFSITQGVPTPTQEGGAINTSRGSQNLYWSW